MVPNIIHLIWFGSYPYNYLDNIKKWKRLNPSYRVKLWSSSSSMYSDEYAQLQSFCTENNIELQDINNGLFIKYPNISHIKQFLDFKLIEKLRFAAASDLLRLSILEAEGGHYFDCDITPIYTVEGINWQCQNGCYQLIDGTTTKVPFGQRYYQYCMMGSEPNNNLYIQANELYRSYHEKLLAKVAHAVRSKQDIKEIANLIFGRTGWVLTLAARELEFQAELLTMLPKLDMLDNLENWQVTDGKLRGRLTISFDRSYMSESPKNPDTQINTLIKPVLYLCAITTVLTTLASFYLLYGIARSSQESSRPTLK